MNPIIRAFGHIYRCKDATRVLSQAQERTLSPLERWKLRMHLRICVACQRFERQLAFIRETLRKYRL
jgi:hypothetical protein